MKAISLSRTQIIIAVVLATIMAATRVHHFGSAVTLPDASLAVFFLAGFYLRPAWLLPVLLAEAALLDYVAITVLGVSDWCVSPAYFFLIPTYAAVWYAGRWYASRHRDTWHTLMPLLGTLALGTGAAFLISNGSFYLFSGRFHGISIGEYVARVVKYFPPYALYTFMYVALAAIAHLIITGAIARRTSAANQS